MIVGSQVQRFIGMLLEFYTLASSETSRRCRTILPVPFEEIGLGHVFPPHGRLNALSRHPVAKLHDVLRVSGLQHRVLKHPELLACNYRKWWGRKIHEKREEEGEQGEGHLRAQRLPPGSNTGVAATEGDLGTIGKQ